MIRQFLALVAILSGLTTLATPAHARLGVCDDVSVQAVDGAPTEAELVAVCAVICAQVQQLSFDKPFFATGAVESASAPTVRIQVDRAHE